MKTLFAFPPLRAAFIYLALGGIWIMLSDQLLATLIPHPAFQTFKDWAFVLASAALIFGLLYRDWKQRQGTEDRLRESETFYRLLFETSLDAILLTAPDGRIFAANPAACQMFGRSEAELRRIGRAGVVDASDPRLQPALEERARTGRFAGELLFVRQDGSTFVGDVSSRLFTGPDGQTRTSLIIRDATERKQTEAELRRINRALQESQQRLSVMFEKTPFAASLSSLPDGVIRQVNEGFETLLGYSRQEAVGKTSLELGLYPDPGLRASAARVVQEHGFGRKVEMVLRTKSGGLRSFLVNMDFVEIGGERFVLALAEDITDQRQSEEKFANAFHVSPTAMTITRIADGRFIDVNESFARLFEYSRDEAIGRTSIELNMLSPEERRKLIQRQRESGGLQNTELEARAKSGRIVNVLFSSRPMLLAGEECHVTIMIDITDRKRAEEEVRRSRDRLAALSGQLVRAHETETRAIGRELHDQIGQMLTALKLTLELAPQLPPEQARRKHGQALGLVDDLLSRVSALSLELRPPMLDDLGLLPALQWHINRYQEQTGLAVDFQHAGVHGRRLDGELETTAYRLVQEALTNIARHAGAAHVSLSVSLDDRELTLRIADDGRGFDSPAALQQGRGLAGMRERAGLVGGRFAIDSRPGAGARITITLPLREAPQ